MDKKKIFYNNPEIWGGIECTINRVKDDFFDQLDYASFYQNPSVEAITDLGIKKLRFPILWENHQPAYNDQIDWKWTEQLLNKIKNDGVDIIAGLVHHGSGPVYTNLLDDNFPYLLAAYAKQVAEKFPFIHYYTPVNEPLTTARFSGLYGFWYPHHKKDSSFLKMLLNELKGTVLAMQEIRKINPQAKLVQTEDLGKIYSTPKLRYQANFENERRWLTFDILCGRLTPEHKLWKFFITKGIEEESLQFFLDNVCVPDLFGFNHYLTSERFLDEKLHLYPPHTHGSNGRHRYADVEAVRVEVEEEIGIEVLVKEAWERYGQPIAITEVHLHCHREEQLRWFKYVWDACKKLTAQGINIQGVTAWAVLGSFGWNRLLTEPGGEYEPGVFDIRSGVPRPTALRNFIKYLTTENSKPHHLSKDKGWWQRDCRYIYVRDIEKMKPVIKQGIKKPVMIIGKNGTLGRGFAKICDNRLINYVLLSRMECDITDIASIQAAVDHHKPWTIINAAGYVNIDRAEREEERCFAENYVGAINLATICQQLGIQLITFSSDQVFDGLKNTPYLELDIPNPLNIYGQSKHESERYVADINEQALIIRTSFLFSNWDGHNFLQRLTQKIEASIPVEVANDVIMSPTYVPDLAHAVLDLLVDDERGTWHLTNKGALNWADFVLENAERLHLDKGLVRSLPLEQMNRVARRPKYSVLGSEKGYLLPTIENAMQRFYDEKTLHGVKEVI